MEAEEEILYSIQCRLKRRYFTVYLQCRLKRTNFRFHLAERLDYPQPGDSDDVRNSPPISRGFSPVWWTFPPPSLPPPIFLHPTPSGKFFISVALQKTFFFKKQISSHTEYAYFILKYTRIIQLYSFLIQVYSVFFYTCCCLQCSYCAGSPPALMSNSTMYSSSPLGSITPPGSKPASFSSSPTPPGPPSPSPHFPGYIFSNPGTPPIPKDVKLLAKKHHLLRDSLFFKLKTSVSNVFGENQPGKNRRLFDWILQVYFALLYRSVKKSLFLFSLKELN